MCCTIFFFEGVGEGLIFLSSISISSSGLIGATQHSSGTNFDLRNIDFLKNFLGKGENNTADFKPWPNPPHTLLSPENDRAERNYLFVFRGTKGWGETNSTNSYNSSKTRLAANTTPSAVTAVSAPSRGLLKKCVADCKYFFFKSLKL